METVLSQIHSRNLIFRPSPNILKKIVTTKIHKFRKKFTCDIDFYYFHFSARAFPKNNVSPKVGFAKDFRPDVNSREGIKKNSHAKILKSILLIPIVLVQNAE